MDITVVSVSLFEFIVSNSKGWKLEQKELFVLFCRIFFVGSIVSILVRLLDTCSVALCTCFVSDKLDSSKPRNLQSQLEKYNTDN